MQITSPFEFSYNSVILSWTPVHNARGYLVKYRISNWSYENKVHEHGIRIIAENERQWSEFVKIGKIFYNVSAIDKDKNVIGEPTSWTYFSCK